MKSNNQVEYFKSLLNSSLSKEEIINKIEEEFNKIREDVPIGVNAIIVNENNEILLLKRYNRYGSGTWGLPGGHLKEKETYEQGISRECKEELDIYIDPNDIQIISFADTITDKRYVQIGGLVKKYKGIPKIMEEHKNNGISFFSKDNLPELFLPNKPNIDLYFINKFYDKNCNYYSE